MKKINMHSYFLNNYISSFASETPLNNSDQTCNEMINNLKILEFREPSDIRIIKY